MRFVKSFFSDGKAEATVPEEKEQRHLAVRAATTVGSVVANVVGRVKDKWHGDENDGHALSQAIQKKALTDEPPIAEWVSFIEGEDGQSKFTLKDGPQFPIPWHSVFLHSAALEDLIRNSKVSNEALTRLVQLCCFYGTAADLMHIRAHPRAQFWPDGLLLLTSALKEDWMSNACAYRRTFASTEARHFQLLAMSDICLGEQCDAHRHACTYFDSVRRILQAEEAYTYNALAVKKGHIHSLRQQCAQRAYNSFREADRAKVLLGRLEYEMRTQTDQLDSKCQHIEEDTERLAIDEKIERLEQLQRQLRMDIEQASVVLDKAIMEKTALTQKMKTVGASYASTVQDTIGSLTETHDVGKIYGVAGSVGSRSREETERILVKTGIALNGVIPMIPDYEPMENPLVEVDVEGELVEANLAWVEYAVRVCEHADASVKEEMMRHTRQCEEPESNEIRHLLQRVEEVEAQLQVAWQASEDAFVNYPREHPPQWKQWEYRRADVWYRMSCRVKQEEVAKGEEMEADEQGVKTDDIAKVAATEVELAKEQGVAKEEMKEVEPAKEPGVKMDDIANEEVKENVLVKEIAKTENGF